MEAGRVIETDDIIEQVADSGGDMTPSLRRVLLGFFQGCGGPEALGHKAAEIFMDDDTNTNTKVKVLDSMTRLTAQYVKEEDVGDLTSVEEVEKRLADLDRD